jgi:hypothetical protein
MLYPLALDSQAAQQREFHSRTCSAHSGQAASAIRTNTPTLRQQSPTPQYSRSKACGCYPAAAVLALQKERRADLSVSPSDRQESPPVQVPMEVRVRILVA